MISASAAGEALVIDINGIAVHRSPLQGGLETAAERNDRGNQAVARDDIMVRLRALQNLAHEREAGVRRNGEEDTFTGVEAQITRPATARGEGDGLIEAAADEFINLRSGREGIGENTNAGVVRASAILVKRVADHVKPIGQPDADVANNV